MKIIVTKQDLMDAGRCLVRSFWFWFFTALFLISFITALIVASSLQALQEDVVLFLCLVISTFFFLSQLIIAIFSILIKSDKI